MIKLTKKQTEGLDILEDFNNGISELIYGGAAASAKSFLGCYWILKNCLRYKGSRWGLCRSELKTLKRTTLKTFFEVCSIQGLVAGEHYVYKEQASEIHFFNGSIVMLIDLAFMPSDEDFDRLGGYEICGAFCDEIAQIRHKAWTILKSRIRYKLKEFGIKPKMIGSLNPSKNWVYTFFYKPWTSGTLPKDKYFIKALPTDNPNNEESYLEILRELPKPQRDRLYLGLWEGTDENQLITQDSIDNLFTNNHIIPTSNKYITIDVARKGKDKTVIMLWYGWVVKEIKIYKQNTITDIIKYVKELSLKEKIPMSNVIADESGVGGGVVDGLRCKGFVGGSKALNDENYLNLRTQAFYHLAKQLNDNGMYIAQELSDEIIKEISEELEQVQSDNSGLADEKLRVISKDQIKSNIGRSPDYSDSLSMRMWFTLNKNTGIYAF